MKLNGKVFIITGAASGMWKATTAKFEAEGAKVIACDCNEKVTEMEKESYQIKTMSFLGTDKAVLVFKKGLKGSLL